MDIFSFIYEPFKINKPIRLIELFGGIGCQAKALTNLGVNYEHYDLVEIDEKAVKSYNAIHGTNFTTQDITTYHLKEIDNDYCNIVTYSFPCTDLSLAGKRGGMEKGSETRSSLLWEVERILDETANLPQVLIMENVPQVLTANGFGYWQNYLEKLGYRNYIQCLNAKNYGIPQNRNRCFMVSLLGDYYYEFPKKVKLKLKLKDMLEDEVDEKYYLSKKMITYLTGVEQKESKYDRGSVFLRNFDENKNIAATITTRAGSRATDNYIFSKHLDETLEKHEIEENDFIDAYNRAVRKDISGTITTRVSAGNDTFIAVKNATKKGYLLAEDGDGVDINSRQNYHRGTVQKGMAQTLTTAGGNDVGVAVNNTNLRIRKLTPRECFRLMGFNDADFDKVSFQSNAELYKQAGNGIVVNVMQAIFKELF